MITSDLALRAREAHAKINLSLRVGTRQADGLHSLHSLVATVRGVSDRVVSDSWDEHIFSVTGAFADDLADALEEQVLLQDQGQTQEQTQSQVGQESPQANTQPKKAKNPLEDNLAWQAAQAFDKARQATAPAPLPLRLEKNLPFGAGFGGGSADAAAVLLLRAGEIPTDLDKLCALGSTLGADIPALLHAESGTGAVWISGSGNICTPAAALPHTYVVLAWPKISLSTQKVYAAFDSAFDTAFDKTDKTRSETPVHSLTAEAQEAARQALESIPDAKGLAAWCESQGNDLAQAVAASCPEAESLRKRLEAQKGCLTAQISGAGSGCFGLFTREKLAVRAAAQLRDAWATVGTIGLEKN